MALNQNFREFLESLNNNQVRYLIIGGFAVAFHGRPRYTKDIDIWVANDQTNAKRMIKALEDFGFSSLGLKEADFLGPDEIIQLGYPPERIDILTATPGVEFEACYANKVQTQMEGIVVNFISIEDLIKNKKAVGRRQDLADVEALE